MGNERPNLMQWLFNDNKKLRMGILWWVFGSLLFVGILSSVVLSALFSNYSNVEIYKTLSTVLISLGTSGIVTVVFNKFYQSKMEEFFIKIHDEDFSEVIENNVVKFAEELTTQTCISCQQNANKIKFPFAETLGDSDYVKLLANLSPHDSYPGDDKPNLDFQSKYKELLEKSQTLYFMGDRTHYLANELIKKITIKKVSAPGKIRILMPDFTDDELLKLKADVIQKYTDEENYPTPESKIKGLREDLLLSLYAFIDLCNTLDRHNQRSAIDFKIKFYDQISIFRSEIFDRAVFVSLLSLRDTKKYPPALLYSQNTEFYKAVKQNFDDVWNHKTTSCEGTPNVLSDEITATNIVKKLDDYLLLSSDIITKDKLKEKWEKYKTENK